MSKKSKKNCDTREFTALKQNSNCKNNKQNNKQQSEQMRMTDRVQKPSFEV